MEPIRSFSLILLFVEILTWTYLINPCESITLISDKDGSWTEGDNVTFTCTINPYTNTLKWRYDSLDVASCGASSCQQKLTGKGAFHFGFDLTTYVFYWTIYPVTLEHENKLFECFDGTTSKPITGKVKAKDDNTRCIAIAAVVMASLEWIPHFVCLGCIIYIFKKHRPSSINPNPVPVQKSEEKESHRKMNMSKTVFDHLCVICVDKKNTLAD